MVAMKTLSHYSGSYGPDGKSPRSPWYIQIHIHIYISLYYYIYMHVYTCFIYTHIFRVSYTSQCHRFTPNPLVQKRRARRPLAEPGRCSLREAHRGWLPGPGLSEFQMPGFIEKRWRIHVFTHATYPHEYTYIYIYMYIYLCMSIYGAYQALIALNARHGPLKPMTLGVCF